MELGKTSRDSTGFGEMEGGLISRGGRILSLSGLKGVQPPLPFGERTRDCSPGHAGKEGPQLARTGVPGSSCSWCRGLSGALSEVCPGSVCVFPEQDLPVLALLASGAGLSLTVRSISGL